MFCKQCGNQMENNTRFCSVCGAAVETTEEPTVVMQTQPTYAAEEGVIDLSGQTEQSLPSEKKYKPILFGGLLSVVAWIFYAVVCRFFHAYVMQYSRVMVFFGIAAVSLVFALLCIPVLIPVIKKAKKTKRKTGKKESVVLYILVWLTAAFAATSGFSDAFTNYGFSGFAAIALFAAFALVVVLYCNALSNQSAEEGLSSLVKAVTFGFLAAIPLGFGLGLLLELAEKVFFFVIIGFVLFFLIGGRIIFVRTYD